MDIFKIEAFVEDKNLAKVKRALVGLVLELKDQPVINAIANGKDVKAQTSGRVEDLLRAWLAKHKLKEITTIQTREFARSIGRSEGSVVYILQQAKKAKVLQSIGRGKYKVLK